MDGSETTSVRNHLKVVLFGLLKHKAAKEHSRAIEKLLQRLGAKTLDIAKALPPSEEVLRVQKRLYVRKK